MTLPAIPAHLLAIQTPAVRAKLVKLLRARPPRSSLGEPSPARWSQVDDLVNHLGTLHVGWPGLRLRSLANWRPGARTKMRYVRDLRFLLSATLATLSDRIRLPWARVRMERQGPKALDSDNLVASLKPVRDAIATWMGIDDADPRVAWDCRGTEGPYELRVVMEYGVAPEGTDPARLRMFWPSAEDA